MEHISKRHNKTLFIYHLVCPAKYRHKIFTEPVEQTLKEVCLGIGIAYEINFLEIGVDKDHVHFLIQTIPSKAFSEVVATIKSITAKEIFKKHPEVKNLLWKGNLWTAGYYANTVGKFGDLKMLTNYVKNQGITDYKQIHHQPTLFD